MEIYALIVLIVLNGFFAMSEIALVSARRARLQPLVEKGDSAARVAAELGAEPTRFLSTVQIMRRESPGWLPDPFNCSRSPASRSCGC